MHCASRQATSEDLDFNAAIGLARVQQLWPDVIKDREHFGLMARLREAWHSDASNSLKL